MSILILKRKGFRFSALQQPAVNLDRPDAELSLKLQRRFQPIQNVLDRAHSSYYTYAFLYTYFFPYPYGF